MHYADFRFGRANRRLVKPLGVLFFRIDVSALDSYRWPVSWFIGFAVGDRLGGGVKVLGIDILEPARSRRGREGLVHR